MMERRSFLHGATALGVGAAATVSASVANAQAGGASRLALPVTGRTAGGEVLGTFSPTRALIGPNGGLQVEGLLNIIGGAANQTVRLPATIQQASCTILDLQLGPLSLNLLGLQVDLSQVNLLITAIPGGGLLGDLLCAIAGLLSGSGNPLGRLITLLNQLLALFR